MSRIDRSKSRSAGGKGFYIALALCLAAVGAIGYFTLIRPANVTIDDPTPPARQTERNDAQWTAPVLQPEPIEVPAVEEEPAPEPEDLLPQVVSPLDGTTVTVFSTTELMYDETMADWRTHNGLDIQAAEGDAVKTAASGMVVSIKSDELMGTTVVIEHAGGYTTQYSCLGGASGNGGPAGGGGGYHRPGGQHRCRREQHGPPSALLRGQGRRHH